MPELFDELGKFTEEGTSLIIETEQALTSIFKKYIDKGYQVRDISHVIGFGLHNVENTTCLKLMVDFLKKKKNENSK